MEEEEEEDHVMWSSSSRFIEISALQNNYLTDTGVDGYTVVVGPRMSLRLPSLAALFTSPPAVTYSYNVQTHHSSTPVDFVPALVCCLSVVAKTKHSDQDGDSDKLKVSTMPAAIARS